MNSQNAYYLTRNTGISNAILEEIISKDDYYSFLYAMRILKDKFELGEEVISKHVYHSCAYALNILKGRFILGEEMMMKHKNFNYHIYYVIKILGYNHE